MVPKLICRSPLLTVLSLQTRKLQLMTRFSARQKLLFLGLLAVFLAGPGMISAQSTAAERGSQTAKGGFRNESDIRDKFNNWRTDDDAGAWLRALGHDPTLIDNVTATKPSGDKADITVSVSDANGQTRRHGISIKLVSSQNGFNQIDKRWLRQYAAMWKMPPDVVAAMRLYLGEDPPNAKSRRPERMFLSELPEASQKAVLEFFSINKDRIAADLIKGTGSGRADWFMVAWRSGEKDRWKVVSADEAVRFFSEGPVEMTRAGNLKIGRISVQRKGGDGGRETAKMLQFKMNPAQIFAMETTSPR